MGEDESPILTVVVDTEEEFDWAKPHSRANTSVTAMRHVERAQRVLDEFGVHPCYVVDYPIASQEIGYAPLRAIHDENRCSIGAQLHPWVNPPHEEDVTVYNSYPGNLPEALECRKLAALNEQITAAFGRPATVYKAGRYGSGPNTAGILEELGFEVDLSPLAAFDMSADGGPDFEEIPVEPWWFGSQRDLLCIPGTAALVGLFGSRSLSCYRLATRPLLEWLRVPGILAHLRLLDRLRLSPEGYTLEEMKRLTEFLLSAGVRVFALSFHSPSMVPGCTPYVNSESELSEFLARIEGYLKFFLGSLGGRSMSPIEMRDYFLK